MVLAALILIYGLRAPPANDCPNPEKYHLEGAFAGLISLLDSINFRQVRVPIAVSIAADATFLKLSNCKKGQGF